MAKSIRPPRGPDHPTDPTGDYPVGYGKPPVNTQFPPGVSGNPKGRPKKSRNIGTQLKKQLSELVRITVNGRSRRVTALEVIIRQMVLDAAKGNAKARSALLALRSLYEEPAENPAGGRDARDDDEVMRALLRRLKGPEGSS